MCVIGLRCELEDEAALSTAKDNYDDDDDDDEDGKDYEAIERGDMFFLLSKDKQL